MANDPEFRAKRRTYWRDRYQRQRLTRVALDALDDRQGGTS